MSEEENPYQSPSLARAEELDGQHRPTTEVFLRYLSANDAVSTGCMVLGFGGALISFISPTFVAFKGVSWFAVPTLLFFSLQIGVMGVYQRQHGSLSMTISAALGLLLLAAFLAAIPFTAMKAISQGRESLAFLAYMLFMTIPLTWAMTIPLRLLLQRLRWKRLGIDVAALAARVRNRPAR